ncbi:hypothetical protein M758_3G248800 [Ceratodon purpureus]|nr:hypothetical protein M758_3G248800 [Ceratodon purpureus]
MESSDGGDALHDASGTSVPSQMPTSKFPGAVGRSWGCSDSKRPWNPDPSNIDMAIPSSDPFRYHPLQQQNEIRLIQLFPPSRTSPHIIECRLVHTLLEYDWPWVAFSYTWSTLEEVEQQVKVHEKILLDGCWFEVTKNLYAALQTMRNHKATASQILLLWIDAICINQSDIVERNKQFQMMGKIYSSAKYVFVWLGEDKTVDSQSAVEFLKSIEYSIFIGEQRRLAQFCYPEMFELVGRSLCSRLWFQRIWVLQEVVLAAEGPGLIVGSNPNPSHMELLLEMAEELYWLITTVRDRPKAPDARGIVAANAMSKLRKWRRSMKPLKFMDLLILTRQFDSTVPHDKIYALRGLATDISEEDLTPDYAKSEAQLYTDVVRFCIRRYKSLNVICLVKYPRKISVLPSWVPDFSINSDSTIAADFTRGFWFTGNGPKAGGSSPCRVEQIVDDPNLLRAEGFCLDILDQVHHDPDTNKEFFTKFLNLFLDPVYRAESRTSTTVGFEGELPDLFDVDNNSDCVADSVHFIGGPYVGGGKIEEAVARTWIGNTEEDGTEVRRDEALVFWRYSPKNVGQYLPLQPRFVNFEDRYWFVHRRLATGRAPFKGHGGYIGWAPAEARAGDLLVVLWGCDWPVVIRRDKQNSSRYRFVGECYCHGAMNGEAVEVQREKGLELEKFALM